MAATLTLSVQKVFPSTSTKLAIPRKRQFRQWIRKLLRLLQSITRTCVTVRLIDTPEMLYLNHTYRGQNRVTNVLSFEGAGQMGRHLWLGDIVLCPLVVLQEAQTQGKDLLGHWAHLTLHGTLHLLGYDHETEQQAQTMEAIEVAILSQLGYGNPYAANEQREKILVHG